MDPPKWKLMVRSLFLPLGFTFNKDVTRDALSALQRMYNVI